MEQERVAERQLVFHTDFTLSWRQYPTRIDTAADLSSEHHIGCQDVVREAHAQREHGEAGLERTDQLPHFGGAGLHLRLLVQLLEEAAAHKAQEQADLGRGDDGMM